MRYLLEHFVPYHFKMHKIIGFVPTLLNIVLEPSLDVSIRQAAALYLKNNISEWWSDPDPGELVGSTKFSIDGQDRQAIRNSIVAAVVSSPLPLHYGSPSVVSKKHRPFAEWYLKSFSTAVLNVLLGVCEVYRQKSFVSKPVLSQTLEYFTAALGHSFAWKTLRTHFLLLVREVIFPLLSHSEEDAELWQDDPIEYIRYEATCVKRRGVLNNIMLFCMHILTSESTPAEKDAVLHMYGAVAELLLKKEAYKSHLEPFLLNHVLPTLHVPEGYRRARACWLVGKLSDANFNDQNMLAQVVEEVRKAIADDPELPVRAFAALCLSELIRSQDQGNPYYFYLECWLWVSFRAFRDFCAQPGSQFFLV
ncbi:importin-7 [Paragonimus westermani]|uniref:Importin-7 n=1 Tax=Paragonimus westermani TaxID=34504 RepID=A0A5J4ND05_9TREM|nr:importin-7 [Paragonimus westermani]